MRPTTGPTPARRPGGAVCSRGLEPGNRPAGGSNDWFFGAYSHRGGRQLGPLHRDGRRWRTAAVPSLGNRFCGPVRSRVAPDHGSRNPVLQGLRATSPTAHRSWLSPVQVCSSTFRAQSRPTTSNSCGSIGTARSRRLPKRSGATRTSTCLLMEARWLSRTRSTPPMSGSTMSTGELEPVSSLKVRAGIQSGRRTGASSVTAPNETASLDFTDGPWTGADLEEEAVHKRSAALGGPRLMDTAQRCSGFTRFDPATLDDVWLVLGVIQRAPARSSRRLPRTGVAKCRRTAAGSRTSRTSPGTPKSMCSPSQTAANAGRFPLTAAAACTGRRMAGSCSTGSKIRCWW